MSSGEPTQEPTSARSAGEPGSVPKGRQSLLKIRRELSDEELSSPAVQRMLIDEIERLESECAAHGVYRDQFHHADKRAAILEEKANKRLASEILCAAGLTVGAAALGYAPAAWAFQPAGWIFLILGAVLIILGILSRVVQK